ncbi:MAG: class I SAM-dependent methyltransferase [Candidatus Auribacterota bacterium]|nr:class I SAM-dependent methyltransferase [Candidatus Auribacterota bacterium]
MHNTVSRFDFNTISGRYDEWYVSKHGLHLDVVEKRAIDRLLPNASECSSLLEIGCGTGHWSEYFSNKGYGVSAIDVSQRMIEIAAKKNIPHSVFFVADGENLPFSNEAFDIVVAITSLEFTPNPEIMFQEMVRCVKKKRGIIILGILNKLSAFNQKRMAIQGSVYSVANMFSMQEIENMIKPLTISEMLVTGFFPEIKRLFWLAPLYEKINRLLSKQGAFIAVRVDL